jgi:hypothetical protein
LGDFVSDPRQDGAASLNATSLNGPSLVVGAEEDWRTAEHFLQSPHRSMPNVTLDANQLGSIVAYILSLRRTN